MFRVIVRPSTAPARMEVWRKTTDDGEEKVEVYSAKAKVGAFLCCPAPSERNF